MIFRLCYLTIFMFSLMTHNNALCASEHILFKEYYIGMSIQEASLLKQINIKENNASGDIKIFNAGYENFTNTKWKSEITFHDGKLINVSLSTEDNDSIQSTRIMSYLNKNNFFEVMLCTKNNIYDIFNIYKKNNQYDAKKYILNGIKEADREHFYISVYVEKETFGKYFSENKKKKIKSFVDIMKNYPPNKRIVIVRNYVNSYFVTFATPFEAILAVEGHLQAVNAAGGLKSF